MADDKFEDTDHFKDSETGEAIPVAVQPANGYIEQPLSCPRSNSSPVRSPRSHTDSEEGQSGDDAMEADSNTCQLKEDDEEEVDQFHEEAYEDRTDIKQGKERITKSTRSVIKSAGNAVLGRLFKGSAGLIAHNGSGSSPNVKTVEGEENSEEGDAFVSDGADGTDGISRQTAMKNFLNSRLVNAKELMNFRKKKPRRKLVSNAGNPLWIPLAEPCCWLSVSGRTLRLRPASLISLCAAERFALQQILLQRLQGLDLGCHLTLPKDTGTAKNRWKKILAVGRKASGSGIQGLFDKDNKTTSPIFGVPLAQVILSDYGTLNCDSGNVYETQRPVPSPREKVDRLPSRRNSAPNDPTQSGSEKDRTAVPSSPRIKNIRNCETCNIVDEDEFPVPNRRASRLLDALTLTSSSASSICIIDRDAELLPQKPQVPMIVNRCIEFMEKYGLHVLGIFRTGGSRKRVRQMRDDIDRGGEIFFDQDSNPQDVAALFKEFFRDLPDPLLSRELYDAFLLTRQIENPITQLMAVKYLIGLLPVPNRDTLRALLTCLSKVASCAADITDADGEVVPGNKMDSRNLATLIGPNILHKAKTTGQPYSVDEIARAEENKKMVEVIKEMIDNCDDLFTIDPELHDDVLRLLLQSDPEAVDYILRKMASRQGHIEMPTSIEGHISRSHENLREKSRRSLTIGCPPLPTHVNDEGACMQNILCGYPSPTNSCGGEKRKMSGVLAANRSDSMRSDRSTYSDSERTNYKKTRDSWSSSPNTRRSQSDSANHLGHGVVPTLDFNRNMLHRTHNRLSDRTMRRKVSAGESTLSSSPHSSRNESRSSTPQSSPATSPRLQRPSPQKGLSRSQSDGSRKGVVLPLAVREEAEKSSGYLTDNHTQDNESQNDLSPSPIFLSDVLDAPSFIKPSTNYSDATYVSNRKMSLTLGSQDPTTQVHGGVRPLLPRSIGFEDDNTRGRSQSDITGFEDHAGQWSGWNSIPVDKETSL